MHQDFIRQLVWLALGVVLLAEPAWGQNPNVTIDDQPTAEQRLEQIIELRRAGRHDAASELMQELIVSSRFKLVSLGEGLYADAERWSSDMLLRDGELRAAYRERYTAIATRALENALAAEARLDELLVVYRLYSATRPGLEAGLFAAGLLLESGEAHSAATLIEGMRRHPDRVAFAQKMQFLRGAAAAYTQDIQTLEDAADALSELKPRQALALKQLAESIQPTHLADRPAQVDMGPKPVSIRAPLWDQSLATTENAGRWLLDDTAVVPVITTAFVLVNNGRQVVALDRASGQRAWAYPADDDATVQQVVTAQRWEDDRSVAVAQGVIAAVLGECHGITERRNPSVQPNRLVGIDQQTGKPIWQRTAGVFRENGPTLEPVRRLNLQHTHFVGTPIISQGKVFTVLRRANSESSTQSSWLMAFDAKDGSLLWYRHLALVSLSYTNADSKRVTPAFTLHGNTLYISDGLTSVGAIDIQTGGYRWLRVLPVGTENAKSIIANSRGVMTAPVHTPAGLMVPLSLSSDRLMLVDPEDGSLLRTFKADPQLNKTQYILETNAGVLAVSPNAVSHWDAQQGAVSWTFVLREGETMRGRGDVSLRFAVIPTSQRLLVLDLALGEVIEQAPAVMGTTIVREGELLAVAEGRLHAYTSWDRVYNRLVQQVKDNPQDPSAGMSLASIAMRQDGQEQSVLQGIGHALDAVSQQPAQRQAAIATRVFDQLRTLIPQAQDPVLRRQLYDRLALVTHSAAQEATYHLDAGLYFAKQGDAANAVGHLHAVIAEPAFAAASYEIDGLTRPASSIAQQALEQLIDRYGRGIYARQDAMAQVRVDELKARGNIDAATLASVARRHPLSPVAGRLLLDAAEAKYRQGRLIDAASLYKQAVRRAVDPAQRQHAAGQLLLFYLETGRPGFASDLLDRLAAAYPGVSPLFEGQPLSTSAWRDRIAKAQATPVRRSALAASLGTPALFPGRLIATAHGTDPEAGSGRLYLHHEDNTITCHSPAEPAGVLWSAKAPPQTSRLLLLADQGEQVLLWSVNTQQVFAIDSATGEMLWQTTVQLDATGDDAQPLIKPAEPAEQPLLTAVSETVVCFGERDSSRLLAIDRASGGVLWRAKLEMTALTGIHADNWSLAAVGRAGHPQQLRSGKFALLGLTDAEPVLSESQLRVALTPLGVHLHQGRATIFGASGVMEVQVPSGQTLWSHRFSDRMLTGAYAVAGQHIAVETSDGQVHLLDASSNGKILDSAAVRGGGDRTPTRLQGIADQLWCRSARGVFRLGPSSTLKWSDAIQTPGLSLQHLMVGHEHVALIAQPRPAPVHNGLELFIFERSGGRLIEQYHLGPLPEAAQPQDAVLFGQGLAIPVGGQTLIVPAR